VERKQSLFYWTRAVRCAHDHAGAWSYYDNYLRAVITRVIAYGIYLYDVPATVCLGN